MLEDGTKTFFVHINVSCHKSKIPTISYHSKKKPNHKRNLENFITIFLQIQKIDFHIDRTTTILCTH
jgi:hypothetical protein